MSMVKIGILGYGGRMGRLIAEEIETSDECRLAGGAVQKITPEYKKSKGVLITPRADEVISISDVVIDFTAPDATPDFVHSAVTHKTPFVCGVTGLSEKTRAALKEAAKKIPVLYASNTSLSLAVTKQAVIGVAKALAGHDYDITIAEEHHRMKKDAPSGTARTLGEAIVKATNGKKKPTYASVRAGYIFGEHEVIFAGKDEIIRIHHSVTDRRVWARGAVQAALWLADQPKGFYTIEDVLGL